MKMLRWLVISILWPCLATAATIECETLSITGGSVVKSASASGGAEVRCDLAKAQWGQIAMLPLPKDLKAGKYELTLRLCFEPVDAYSDRFVLTAGSRSKTFMSTDFPDPQASDYRLWNLTFTVEEKIPDLFLQIQRAKSNETKTAAIRLDTLDIKKRGDDVYMLSIRPSKVLYLPEEEAVCAVKLRNAGKEDAEREVMLLELVDLGGVQVAGRQKVKVKGLGEETVTFKWKLGMEQYGREVRVQVFDPKQKDPPADWESEYFNVSDNVWKVAMRGPSGPHMTHPDSSYCDIKTPEAWQKYLVDYANRIHADYGNFNEWFAWAPDDAFFMTPTAEMWISGQGCYQHLRSRVLDLNRVMNENGVWPITYAKSAASGPPCYEYMRKHPEYGMGRYQVQFDQQCVRDWDKQIPGKDKTIFYNWMSLVLDITKPKVVDYALNEILNSAEMFGFRGARYDDHYTYWGKPYDELSTKNMQRIFDLGRQRNPGFVWGFNYIVMATQCVWPGQALPDQPWKQKPQDASIPADPHEPRWEKMPEPYPELKIACENGGYIMNEEAREARTGTYSNYARLLLHETRYVRKLGGHYGPIPFDAQGSSAFDRIYPDILRAAARAHTYGNILGDTNFKQFITRYSSYIYGTALEPILDPEPLLTVEAKPGVWWHSFAYTWKDGDRRRVLAHLLAVPKNDKINSNTSGDTKKITDVTVTYTGPGEIEKAWELSPFIEGFSRPLNSTGRSVKPQDFHLWKLVVLELKGGTK